MTEEVPPWKDGNLAWQLYDASLYGQYSDVLALLQKGTDPDGLLSLHGACRDNYPECVNAFLLWGADPERTSGDDGRTPLHRACYYNSLPCVKVLLAHHCSTDTKTNSGKTAVDLAREKGNLEVADFVDSWVPLSRGPLSNFPSINKLSSLQVDSWMLGCHLGLTEKEMEQIKNTGYPTTYTFLAAKVKNMESLQWKDVVQALLTIGEHEQADHICRKEEKGQTVLSVCAYYGWLEFIRNVKEYNPGDPANDFGDTVLAIACARGNMAIIDYFVNDKSWDLNGLVNKAGQTLRSLAESLQLSEVIKYLDNLIESAGIGEQQKYMESLDEMIGDTKNTILLRFLKMYFIGSSGIGKSTTRNRLIGLIVNLISLPEEERKRRSTNLAECNQVLAVMDETEAKLTLKASSDFDDETRLLFAYVYHHLFTADQDDSSILAIPSHTGSTNLAVASGDVDTIGSGPQPGRPNAEVSQGRSSLINKQVVTKVDEVIARFRSIVGSGKYAEQLMNKVLINLIDMGGQPGFLEMLPFLSRGPGMFLAFFRLDKELDELCEVSYEREGDKITPYKATFTIRETLSQILSAIDHHVAVAANTTADQQFRDRLGDLASMKPIATLVGTFKDKVETKVKTNILSEKITEFSNISQTEKVKALEHVLASLEAEGSCKHTTDSSTDVQKSVDQLLASESVTKEIQDRLGQELSRRNSDISAIASKFDDLLFHPADDQYFIALDNFKGTESDLDPLREHLQAMFETFFEDKKLRIRPAFLLLGVILRKEYDIVSMDDCIRIGRALSMTEKDVRFTIWYLDQWAGVLIYRPEIGDWFQRNIICSPQVVFDSISSLIVESLFKLHSPTSKNRFLSAEQKDWKVKGQFSLNTVKRCHSKESKEKIKQGKLIPEDKLVKFLQHCNLLSLIYTKTKRGRSEMCFIPAILECASPEELTKSPPPDSDTPCPIKITFETGYVPIGMFCALISQLVSRGSEGILGMIWVLVESGVKRNLISFLVDSVEHIVTLVAHVDCYEIRLIRQDRRIKLNDLCYYVLSTILYTLKEICESIAPILAFDCQCDRHKLEQFDKLCCFSPGVTSCFKCEYEKSISLSPYQECWFTKVVQPNTTVSLKALPYVKRPDKTLSFEWFQDGSERGTGNELKIEYSLPNCEGYYTCDIMKSKKLHFSVYHCLKVSGGPTTSVSSEDQLLDDVRQAIRELRADWYSLAIELDIDYGTRKAIVKDYRFVDVCFHAMLHHWVKKTPTKSALIKALKSKAIDRQDIAKRVETKLEEVTGGPGDCSYTLSTLDPHGFLCVDKHLKVVRENLWDARSQWYDLGQQLGIDIGTLETIESDYSNKSDLCLTHLLECWLTRTPPPTLSVLIEALESPTVGRKDIASNS